MPSLPAPQAYQVAAAVVAPLLAAGAAVEDLSIDLREFPPRAADLRGNRPRRRRPVVQRRPRPPSCPQARRAVGRGRQQNRFEL
eukprot:2671454-Pleurochrysis_carterae.AAC.2